MPIDLSAAAAAASALQPILRRSTIPLSEAANEAAWRQAVARRGWHALYIVPAMVQGGGLARVLEDTGGRLLVARVNAGKPLVYEAAPFNVAIASYFASLGDTQMRLAGAVGEVLDKVPNPVPDVKRALLYAALIAGGFYLLAQSARAPRVTIGRG